MISVSIVENLPEIRSGLERLIKEQKDILLLSSSLNSEDAIPLIKEAQPDIVIMDINMPGISGIECIRKIKDDCPATQFMIFSIYETMKRFLTPWLPASVDTSLKKHPPKKFWKRLKSFIVAAAR